VTEEALRYIKRILELLAAAGITDSDALKHTLKDAERWRADLFAGRLVERHELEAVEQRVAALRQAFTALAARWDSEADVLIDTAAARHDVTVQGVAHNIAADIRHFAGQVRAVLAATAEETT
jgi:hypothetical protein